VARGLPSSRGGGYKELVALLEPLKAPKGQRATNSSIKRS